MRALPIAAVSVCLMTMPIVADEADPAAIALDLQQAMGVDSFATARVLHFVWAVEREGAVVASYDHTWDRWTGDYRVEGVDRDSGEPWLALFNVDSREGRVWLAEEEVRVPTIWPGHLERAYGRFINDTYWLLMPWKWLDSRGGPGVRRHRGRSAKCFAMWSSSPSRTSD